MFSIDKDEMQPQKSKALLKHESVSSGE